MPTTTITIARLGDATEGGGTGTFRLTRTETSGSLFASVSYSGSTSGADYYGDPLIVMFADGNASIDIVITAVNDSTSEPTETLVCTINSSALYTVGTPSSATMNILDNDAQVVGVTATAEGSATGGFTFTRIGNLASSLTVDYTIDGTADPEDDYEELSGSVTFEAGADWAEVSVVAEGENLAEDDETVELTIDSGSGYSIDSEADEATVGIGDQPLTLSVVMLSDGEEGAGNGTFRFIRAGDISEALTVDYTVSGTATSGTDYTALSGSVTFAEVPCCFSYAVTS